MVVTQKNKGVVIVSERQKVFVNMYDGNVEVLCTSEVDVLMTDTDYNYHGGFFVNGTLVAHPEVASLKEIRERAEALYSEWAEDKRDNGIPEDLSQENVEDDEQTFLDFIQGCKKEEET